MSNHNHNPAGQAARAVSNFVKPKRPYDPTDNKGNGYRHLWAVYPDKWPEKWGQKPCLGFVRADNEYYAKYAACDKGLWHPNNCTFGLQFVRQDPGKPAREKFGPRKAR